MQFTELKKLPEMYRFKGVVTLPSGNELTIKTVISPKRFRDNHTKKGRVVKECTITISGVPGDGEDLVGLSHVFENLESICQSISDARFEGCEDRFDLSVEPMDGSKGQFRSNTHIGVEGLLTDFESAKAALLNRYPELSKSGLHLEQLPEARTSLDHLALCLANQIGREGIEFYKEFKNEPEFLPVNLVNAVWKTIRSEIPEDKAQKPDNKAVFEALLKKDSPYTFSDFMVSFAQVRRIFGAGSSTVRAIEDTLLSESSDLECFRKAFIPIYVSIRPDYLDACEVWKRLKENSSEKTLLDLLEIVTRLLNDERRSNSVVYSLKGSLVDNPVSLRDEMPKRIFDGWAHPLLWIGCAAAKSDSSYKDAFRALALACKDTMLRGEAIIAEGKLGDSKK